MLKRCLAIPAMLSVSLILCTFGTASWAQCPEFPADNGMCDTMYVEVYECDWLFAGQARQVRVPIRVTNDIPNPAIDSISGMVIPLCFTSSNAGANAIIDPNKNTLNTNPFLPDPVLNNSIFRHLPDMGTATEINFMMDYAAQVDEWGVPLGLDWDTKILDLTTLPGSHFWMLLLPTGTQDQRFCGGSRALVATMTFTVDDTMTICLDSCFWPPTGRLAFSRSDAIAYIPRHSLPYCFSMSYPDTGDCNADCTIDIGDLVYLINYLFRNGDPPVPVGVGDANCDGIINVGDVVYLLNYLYKGGDPPGCP